MLESPARAARAALRERGGNLVIARGTPEQELSKLAREHGAEAVYFASDASPFAIARDRRVEAALREAGVEPRRTPGNFVADIGKPKPYAVFTPFWRAWKELPRREVHGGAAQGRRAVGPARGGDPEPGRAEAHAGGPRPVPRRRARRPRADARVAARRHRQLRASTTTGSPAAPRSSRPTCTSAASRRASWRSAPAATRPTRASSPGATSTPTCSCTTRTTRATPTAASSTRSSGTARTRTSTPGARAAPAIPWSTPGMRQLAATGWMHNRARLITACFLVKDLHIDWRRGEQHFMRLLLDGDQANNNGNWQWISSVGVDPAPLHRRLYNPVLQQQRHDPDGRVRAPLGPGARGHPAREARHAVGGGRPGADRRPRGRAAAHARGLRRRARLVSCGGDGALHARAARAVHARLHGGLHRGLAAGPGRVRRRRGRARTSSSTTGAARRASCCARTAPSSTGPSRPTTRSGRSRRPRGSSRSTTTAAATRRSASATRSSASCSAAAATCARCSSTRPTRRRHGRSSPRAPTTRRPTKLRDALSADGIFPAPGQLLQLRELDGLPANKVPRLHGIAQAALEGKLDREPLLAADTDDAFTQLLELPGIGPFYAGLILLRAVGTVDVAPKGEPRLERAVQERYGEPVETVAERWKPFRTWVSVLMRASA